jgi:hypothetical protein
MEPLDKVFCLSFPWVMTGYCAPSESTQRIGAVRSKIATRSDDAEPRMEQIL